jgi:alpha-beta hydrolase superfamily lysophospholipase
MPASELAEALYFASGSHRLFGWLHRAPDRARTQTATGIGLVVCKPFGYESICAHRGMRAFSEAAANLGVPTLRFDYTGTGDSSDVDPRTDQLQVWVEDVLAAIAEIRRRTDVERVYLLGFRLGSVLAALAARRCAAVGGLILVGPIISGRRYLRDLRMTRMAASIGSDAKEVSNAAVAAVGSPDAGQMEVSGFMLSAATLATLAQVDLKKPGLSTAYDVLVIDDDKMPVARAWVEELGRLGVRATYQALPGLVEMTMTAPQFATMPVQMVTAMCDWLRPLAEGSRAPPNETTGRDEPRFPSQPAMNLPVERPGQLVMVTEKPVLIGSEAVLFGIVTEPAQIELCEGAVILLNAGADYHIGASGMYVGLARRWAARGYIVLRIDLAGLGDSGTRPGQPDNVVFPPAALDDVRAAVQWMRTEYALSKVSVCGVCSGAYHALRAAATTLPVSRVLMVNPETFFWNETMSIYDMHLAEIVGEPVLDRKKVLSTGVWKRLLAGRIDVRYIARRAARRAFLAFESNIRKAARRLHIRLPNDLGAELEQIGARGIRMAFVFSRGEPGIALLRIQGGISLKRLGERCRIHIIDGADHVFSKLDSRTALENILTDELLQPIEASVPHRVADGQTASSSP